MEHEIDYIKIRRTSQKQRIKLETNKTIVKCNSIVQNFNFVQNMMDLPVIKFSKGTK